MEHEINNGLRIIVTYETESGIHRNITKIFLIIIVSVVFVRGIQNNVSAMATNILIKYSSQKMITSE